MTDRCCWMRTLADKYPPFANKPLTEIALPGSHDSASHEISNESPLAPNCEAWVKLATQFSGTDRVARWSKCQNFKTFEQLQHGVRYFDLRVCWVNDEDEGQSRKLWVCHCMLSVPLIQVLEDIKTFVEGIGTHEVIVLDFQHVAFPDNDAHHDLLGMLLSVLGERLCIQDRHTCRMTLSDLWKTEERIVVIYGSAASNTGDKIPWLWDRPSVLTSPWHDTTDNAVLLREMDQTRRAWVDKDVCTKMFTVTQTQRAPNASMVLSLLPGTPKSLEELARGTHPQVCDWLERQRQAASISGKWSGNAQETYTIVEILDKK